MDVMRRIRKALIFLAVLLVAGILLLEGLNRTVLPAKARQYLDRLSELVDVPFCLISTGAVRDETILCEDSPLTRWFPGLTSALS